MLLKIEIKIDAFRPFVNLAWILRSLAQSVGSFAPWWDAGKPHTMALFDKAGDVCGKWGIE